MSSETLRVLGVGAARRQRGELSFSVLGPVEVRRGEEVVALGGSEELSLADLLQDAGAEDPLAVAEERDMTSAINRALNALPPRQSQVITLRYFDGLPFAEISHRLGISPVTTRRIHDTAIRRLRDLPA